MPEEPLFRAVDPADLRVPTEDWSVLVAVEHAQGIAGVCLDPEDGGHWLAGVLELGGSAGLHEGEPSYTEIEGLGVTGGLLRPGVHRMLVRERNGRWTEAAVQGRAWLVVTEGRPLVLRELDDVGAVVRPELPGGAQVLGPVEDAVDGCIACDAVAWDVMRWAASPVPSPHADEDGPFEDGAAAVCRTCGHFVTTDPVVHLAPDAEFDGDDPGLDGAGEEPVPALTDAEQASWAMLPFTDARFPVYGIAEWSGERCWLGHGSSWASSGGGADGLGETTSIRLGHGPPGPQGGPLITVETEFEVKRGTASQRLREAMERLASRSLSWPWERSEAAKVVHFERAKLTAGVAASLALVDEIDVVVDGAACPFLMGHCAGGWVAFGVIEVGEERTDRCALTVTVTATDQSYAPFALSEVVDVAPYVRSRAADERSP